MNFCAVCTSTRGPFSLAPVGKNDGMVRVCSDCDPSVDVVPMTAMVRAYVDAPLSSLTPEQLVERGKQRGRKAAMSRRDRNKALGRCINHPLTDRSPPHAPRVDGHVRCAACIEVHARGMGRARTA